MCNFVYKIVNFVKIIAVGQFCVKNCFLNSLKNTGTKKLVGQVLLLNRLCYLKINELELSAKLFKKYFYPSGFHVAY